MYITEVSAPFETKISTHEERYEDVDEDVTDSDEKTDSEDEYTQVIGLLKFSTGLPCNGIQKTI